MSSASVHHVTVDAIITNTSYRYVEATAAVALLRTDYTSDPPLFRPAPRSAVIEVVEAQARAALISAADAAWAQGCKGAGSAAATSQSALARTLRASSNSDDFKLVLAPEELRKIVGEEPHWLTSEHALPTGSLVLHIYRCCCIHFNCE
jgi:hypothetical protein